MVYSHGDRPRYRDGCFFCRDGSTGNLSDGCLGGGPGGIGPISGGSVHRCDAKGILVPAAGNRRIIGDFDGSPFFYSFILGAVYRSRIFDCR
ncbi:hypothetical protein C4565_05490 [Candidatus Parcubacteria bacterium]|nr:MAG: hypothetical protein C4565_05490 [Candidatus Parcubacteria bacterium]